MSYTIGALRTLLLTLAAASLTACTTMRSSAPSQFDLGALEAETATVQPLTGLTISVADVRVPGWLDTPRMLYRLNYSQAQRTLPFSSSRWSMPPGELMTQRLSQRLAEAGAAVLSASYGTSGVPLLRVDMDEFTQHFPTVDSSYGRVTLRATLFDGARVVSQRTFSHQRPTATADAVGGAEAIAAASDATIAELIKWIHALTAPAANR